MVIVDRALIKHHKFLDLGLLVEVASLDHQVLKTRVELAEVSLIG